MTPVLLAALLAAPASAADAQFGKLVRRAAAAAAQAANPTAPDAPRSAGDGAGRPTEPALEVTAARLDALLAAWAPSVTTVEGNAARTAAHERQVAARAAYERCWDAAMKAVTPADFAAGSNEAAMSRAAAQMTELANRAVAVQATGDAVRIQAIQDSITAAGDRATRAQFPTAARRCGAAVPPAGLPPVARPVPTPAVPAGMSVAQFGLLRERVAAWALSDNGRMAYSDAERVVLAARRAQLAPLVPLLQGQALHWARWSDLTTGSAR